MNLNTYKFFVIILAFVVISVLLKSTGSQISKLFSIAVCIIVMTYSLSSINPIIDLIKKLSEKANVSNSYLKIILKSIGICIIGDFTSNLCKDAGENALSFNCDLLCRISIISLSLPMYIDIFNIILKLWEN